MRLKPAEIAGTVIIIVFILVVVVMAFIPSIREAPKRQCFTNMKELAVALSTYAEDSDAHYPLKENWAEALSIPTILENRRCMVCPEAHPNAEEIINLKVGEKTGLPVGYAFFAPLSGKYILSVQEPGKVPLFFDSSQYKLNNSTDISTLIFRHSKKTANILFADGSAKTITEVPVIPKVIFGKPKPPEEPKEGEEDEHEHEHGHEHGGPPSIWQQMPSADIK